MTGAQTSEIHFVHHKSHVDWPGILGFVVTRFTHIAPGLTKKAWHFVHTATVSPHSIHCLQAQCSMWDMNWILIQQTDVSLHSVNNEQVLQHFDRIRMYIVHTVLNMKYENIRQQNYSWSVGIAQSVLWLHYVEFPADCGQPVSHSMDARDSFTGGKVAGEWSWPLTTK